MKMLFSFQFMLVTFSVY